MSENYGNAVLHKDYYNNASASEIKGLYNLRNQMRKWERNEFLFCFIPIMTLLIFYFVFTASLVKTYGSVALLFGSKRDSIGECLLLIFIGAVVCVIDFAAVFYRWKEFYIGVGEVIAAECEYVSPDKSKAGYLKKYPGGYYKCALDIAVSDGLAVTDVTYFSPVPINIGERAASVYFPRTHLLYAVCGDFTSNENAKDFRNVIHYSRHSRREELRGGTAKPFKD